MRTDEEIRLELLDKTQLVQVELLLDTRRLVEREVEELEKIVDAIERLIIVIDMKERDE